MENFKSFKALIEGLEKDAEAFFKKNNKSAGTRLRVGLQQTKVLAQALRNEITGKKNQK